MDSQQIAEIPDGVFSGFEEATPLAFGYGDTGDPWEWIIYSEGDAEPVVWLAAWALLLSRYSGESSITLGFQGFSDDEPRPLWLEVRENQLAESYLKSIAGQIHSQSLSEAELRRTLGLDSETPLFNCVVSQTSENRMEVRGRGSYSAETLTSVKDHLNRLVAAIAQLELVVRSIPHLSEAELNCVIKSWNPAPTPYPQKTVQELFEVQVEERSQAVALIFNNERVTYEDLNKRANRLAHYLIEAGVQSGQSVATFLERGVPQIVATLAILKAGAAYIPLDVEFPSDRIGQMLEDAAPPVILSHSGVASRLVCPAGTRLMLLDDIEPELACCSMSNPAVHGRIDSLAYIMYTSGSTGRPKGVEVMHRGIVRLLFGVDYVPFGTDTVMLHMAAASFDASTLEIWGPLLHGGTCVLSPSRVPTLETIGHLLEEHQVNILWMTASLFNLAITAAPQILKPVRYLLAGGEALSPWHVEKAMRELPGTQLINGYGPTENTTFSTTYAFDRHSFEPSRPIPIGRAIGHSTCYILDRYLRPVAPGVPGELYVGGDGVARGYAGHAELTAERFLADPFSDQPNARMYKTGDLVYWNRDGQIEFIGRGDNQIKLRGFRIELQDIDSALSAFPGVEQAVTILYEDEGRGKWLAGFVKVANPEGFPLDELKSFAYQKLPDYMVPAALVPVGEWAYTPSGKLDRSALPKPHLSLSDDQSLHPPETETQSVLVSLWQKLLSLDRVSIDDNFFELGGDSLCSVHLFHEISQRFGRELPLAILTQQPTIRSLASAIDGTSAESELAGFRCLQLIQQGDPEVAPLFMIHGGAGNVLIFREFAQHLGSQQPVYAFQWSGWDGNRGHSSIVEMAAAYKEELLRFRRMDNYRLGGHCIGGLIAIELAHQLRQDGIGIEGPLIVSDCPNLGALSYRKAEPESSDSMREDFLSMVTTLESLHREWVPWHSSELDRNTGLKGWLKRSILMVSVVHWLRGYPGLFKLKLGVALGRKVAVSQRPFYSGQTLVIAAQNYKAQPYVGHIAYFRSACVFGRNLGLQGWWADPFMGFGELCDGRFDAYVVGGEHNDVLKVEEVADIIKKALD